MSRSKLLLTLFSKSPCGLCVDAKLALTQAQKRIPFDLKVVDITAPGNEKFAGLYAFDIPVIHLLQPNGLEVRPWMMHKIEEEDVVAKLRELMDSTRAHLNRGAEKRNI